MSRLKRLIVEIHRRSLWQVLLIYCGAALVAYQAVQALTEGLGLPQWFPALAIVLFIVGLPIVLATAFVHELAPPAATPREPTSLTEAEAAKIEAEAAAVRYEARRRHRLLTWRNATATFVVVLAAWGVVATGWLLVGERAASANEQRKSIAVLPLENLSPDPQNAFFAAGLHEDVLSQLSKIHALDVISRTSVLQYAGTEKDIPTIAEELGGVDGIVEGSVRRAGDQVRVVLQLIDKTDVHLWSETYDRDLTVANVFAIQSDIARQIARALEAELTWEEQARIEEIPTDNLEAYDFYLRGMQYWRRPGYLAENWRSAQRMLEQAVELDPSFALARAWLSIVHSATYWEWHDFTEERLRQAREAADRALELDPDLPQGHLALGYYLYWGFRAYDQALDELALAERSLPGDADVLTAKASIYRRQARWQEAIATFQRAAELDPRVATRFFDLGWTHDFLRRYDEAERYFDRALAIESEYEDAVYHRARVELKRRGDLEPLRAFLSTFPEAHYRRYQVRVLERDYAAALAGLSQLEDSIIIGQLRYHPPSLDAGLIHVYSGQPESARSAFDSARVFFEAAVSELPDDPVRRSGLGLAYAGLGLREEAVREGQMAVELMPLSTDAAVAPLFLERLAQIHALVGDSDTAIDQLDYLLSIPSHLSVPILRLHPVWDPLRDHPRFQALLEEYE